MGVSVANTPENMKLCICGTCPIFKGSPLSGGFFCATGKAKELVKQTGCVCGKCGVTVKYGIKGGVWCVRGKSADVK